MLSTLDYYSYIKLYYGWMHLSFNISTHILIHVHSLFHIPCSILYLAVSQFAFLYNGYDKNIDFKGYLCRLNEWIFVKILASVKHIINGLNLPICRSKQQIGVSYTHLFHCDFQKHSTYIPSQSKVITFPYSI